MASIPKPLAVRKDSLLVQCCIAAAIYFIPQDAAILGIGAIAGRARSRNANAPVALQDPKAGVDSFLKSRGLADDQVQVKEGRSNWEVKLKNVYQ